MHQSVRCRAPRAALVALLIRKEKGEGRRLGCCNPASGGLGVRSCNTRAAEEALATFHSFLHLAAFLLQPALRSASGAVYVYRVGTKKGNKMRLFPELFSLSWSPIDAEEPNSQLYGSHSVCVVRGATKRLICSDMESASHNNLPASAAAFSVLPTRCRVKS